MQMPGGRSHHQAIRDCPLICRYWSIMPQVTLFTSPNPRNANMASVTIAPLMVKVMYRNVYGRTFGAMCLNISLDSLAPAIIAAFTKARSLRDNVTERMTLAMPAQDNIAMIIMMLTRDGPKTAANRSSMTRPGRLSMTSVARIR